MGGLVGAAATIFIIAALLSNTDFGRTTIASLIANVTRGRVVIQGLSGRIPNHLRVQHFALSDVYGVWLTLDDVTLDWNPLPLLWNRFAISRVEAGNAH